MKWNKYILKTTVEVEDFIGAIFMDAGINSFEIVDNVIPESNEEIEKHGELIPKNIVNDGISYISFYIAVNDGDVNDSLLNDGIKIEKSKLFINEEEVLLKVKNGLEDLSLFVDIGDATIKKYITKEEDWANKWKEHFKAFEINDILIKPTWQNDIINKTYRTVINIDPGNAFGTGTHSTTKLCVASLEKYLKKDDNVLDLGCGSGILSILSMKLGAKSVDATDIDKNAVDTSINNSFINNIEKDKIRAYTGDVLNDRYLNGKLKKNYDVVVANILSDVIILMSPFICDYLKVGGIFISSGIINTKSEKVKTAIENTKRFDIIETSFDGDWVSFVAKKIV